MIMQKTYLLSAQTAACWLKPLKISRRLYQNDSNPSKVHAASKSRVCAILGAQWGDEGKGKLADVLAEKFDIVARYNGGANAGHTIVYEDKKFAFHLLPCGLVYPHTTNVLGNGVVVNLDAFFEELQPLKDAGIDTKGRIKISNRSHLLFNFYKEVDAIIETRRADTKIGTTKKGIGPAYASKALRLGIRTGDILDWETFLPMYNYTADSFMNMFNFKYDKQMEIDKLKQFRELLLQEKMVIDGVHFLNTAYNSGKRILVEGANAALLDIDYGSYPYVTSSSTTVGGIATGLGLSCNKIDTSIGVVKAYTTRVGSGDFPTELNYDTHPVGIHLQTVGREVGVTTGRRRRCGWLDIPLLRYSHLLNSFSSINITKLDVLDQLKTVQICYAYKYKPTGAILPDGSFPSTMLELSKIEPMYIELEGWKCDTSKARTYGELPIQARKYIEKIEELLGVKVGWIGVGANRDAMIVKN